MPPLVALLCLGLSVSTRTPVQAGSLPKPTLSAEPGSVIPRGSPVTFWCWGNKRAQKFYLDKTGSSSPLDMQLLLKPGNKAKFFFPYITEAHAGTYDCYYLSPGGYSERSEPLELVVTGLHQSKPSLSAFLSPVVASGETVALQCDSWRGFDTFVLTQEGDAESPKKIGSQRLSSGGRQALFKVGPVTPDRRWSFRCYGFFSQTPQLWSYPSNPLQLLVSGASRKPSLLSPKGQIVSPGKTLSLQCRSKDAYHTFALYKEESQAVYQHPDHHSQAGLSQANFTLGPVSDSDGGQYRCIGRHSFTSLWSEPSDPVDILVEGQLSCTPVLSVQPGPAVSPGDNVTLLCQCRHWMDTFLLAKDGAADPPLRIKVNKTEAVTQAQFFFHPVTSAHNGSYRCYRSDSSSPYRLSYPSNPLQLRVSGPSGDSRTMSTPVVDRNNPDPLLIGLSTAGALFGLLLLFLLLFLRHLHHRRQQAGHRKSGAAHPVSQDTGLHSRSRPRAHVQKGRPDTVTHTQSEEGARLNPQSRQDEDPSGAIYAQVKHAGLRQGVVSCTQLSGARLNAQDGQTEEDTQASRQADAPEATLEVTYAQLNHLNTAQGTTVPPSSLLREPPEEPSVYAALAFS